METIERPARRRSAKLTKRGRVVIVLALAMVLLAAFSLGRVSSQAATSAGSDGAATAATAHRTVVVQPGDTLWSIAKKAAPRADVRVTVQRIEDLNALRAGQVVAGQEITLPS